LKYELANWLTGKLSGMGRNHYSSTAVGILFPKLKQRSIWLSAMLFAFWKSPFSQDLINLYNQVSFIQTSRIIDFTDFCIAVVSQAQNLKSNIAAKGKGFSYCN